MADSKFVEQREALHRAKAREKLRALHIGILSVAIAGSWLFTGCSDFSIGADRDLLPTPSARAVLPSSGAFPGKETPVQVIPLALPDMGEDVSSLIWSSDDGRIVLGGASGITLLQTGPTQPQIQSADAVQFTKVPSEQIFLLADAEQASAFAFSTIDNSIFLFDPVDTASLLQQRRTGDPITGIALSPDGSKTAYSTYSGSLSILPNQDIASAQSVQSWELPAWLSNLSFSPDGKYVGGVDLSNFTIYLINADTGQVERILEWLESPGATLYAASFSDNWRKVAWIAQTAVQIMQVSDGTLGPMLNHADHIAAFAWSPDGRYFATGSAVEDNDGLRPAVLIWDPESGYLLETLPQTSAAASLAFSPDGSQIAVLHPDGSLQVWNLASTH